MRCRACNKILKEEEIIFRKSVQQWEDLCLVCRSSVFEDNNDLDIDGLGIDVTIDTYSYKEDT